MACDIIAIEIVNPIALWNNIPLNPVVNAQDADWFELETVDNVAGADLGWHLAAGWVLDGDPVDDPANKPHKKYSLKKNVLQSDTVLNDLVDQYVASYNEGRTQNDTRFDDIVAMFNDTLLKTQSQLDRAAVSENCYNTALLGSGTLFLTDLESIISQIDGYLNITRSDATDSFDAATSALNLFAEKLNQLQAGTGDSDGYDRYVTQIEAILTNQGDDLDTFESRIFALLKQLAADFTTTQASIATLEATEDSQAATHIASYDAKLAELEATIDTVETDLLALVDDAETTWLKYQTQAVAIITTISGEYTSLDSTVGGLITELDTAIGSHQTTHAGLVALFLSDYTTHAVTARAFLVDLGATELARINRDYDNQLSRALQDVTERGLYSSSLVTRITAKNTQDRTESITVLNDRLAREKLTDEHVLYGQQVGVRQRQVAGEEYQFQMTQLSINFRAQWAERLYGLVVEANQIYLSVRDSLRGAENEFITQNMSVKERIANWRLETKKTVADGKDRVYQIRSAITRWKTDNKFKLDALLRQVRGLNLDIYVRDLTAQTGVDRFAATSRESILTRLHAYVNDFVNGEAKFAGLTIQNGQFLAAVKDRATADAIQTRYNFTAGLTDANLSKQALYRFQVDARNNLAVAMFNFMERRTDAYPDVGKMGEIAVGLGVSGAPQWTQP